MLESMWITNVPEHLSYAKYVIRTHQNFPPVASQYMMAMPMN